jgi:hypothetical protein
MRQGWWRESLAREALESLWATFSPFILGVLAFVAYIVLTLAFCLALFGIALLLRWFFA